jgi:hypothetical protein
MKLAVFTVVCRVEDDDNVEGYMVRAVDCGKTYFDNVVTSSAIKQDKWWEEEEQA